MKILIADDDRASRELMREILELSGYRIVEAANGREALDLIRQNQPELVFLDLQMPILDGLSVIRELRADVRFRHLPVVAVTATAMQGDRERAIAAGFDSYIAKPINLGDVRGQAKLLSSRRSYPDR